MACVAKYGLPSAKISACAGMTAFFTGLLPEMSQRF
jgi:hypothetical protein